MVSEHVAQREWGSDSFREDRGHHTLPQREDRARLARPMQEGLLSFGLHTGERLGFTQVRRNNSVMRTPLFVT